jgi:ribosomal protein S18 acetylase RimI-like enzyme
VTVAVRPQRDADRAFVHDLARRTARDSLPAHRPAADAVLDLAIAQLLDSLEGRDYRAFVAESGGRRAGFLLLLEDLPDEMTAMPQAFVAYMAVEPDFRRHGVGRALLEAGEQEARRRGLPYVALMVSESNAPARALYERHGYVTERRLMCKPL